MERVRVHKTVRPRTDVSVPLPLDPRDPAVVRAKRLRDREATRTSR